MERNIAVYSSDGALLQWIDQKRCQRLVDCGRVARVVKTRLGRVRRLTLLRMAGEWQPSFLSDYNGTQYSFRQHLADGHRCHRLAALGDNRNDEGYYLAPDEVRPVFLAVILDCLVPAVVA
jgi:hypothetical protein